VFLDQVLGELLLAYRAFFVLTTLTEMILELVFENIFLAVYALQEDYIWVVEHAFSHVFSSLG
jgi:hypothetical protein